MRLLILIITLLYSIPAFTATHHPADTNQDWKISLEEFNAYNTSWRQAVPWSKAPTTIPVSYVTRAGYLHTKGGCYYEKTSTSPMNWQPDQDCDQTIDSDDGCPNDPNKIHPGECGCGMADNGCREQFTNSIGMTFVYIPPGTFMMGSPPDEPIRMGFETQHQVTLTNGYYLQTTEVTQGQWKIIMGNNPSYFKNCGDDCPVEQVSWNDTQDFIQKLNQKEGYAYRLPTEAEWEYAARAGTTTALYNGPIEILGYRNAPALDPIAWYSGNSCVNYSGGCNCSHWRQKQYNCSNCGTHPVAQKKANVWGLYDMSGNVFEWCQDRYVFDLTTADVIDPTGPATGEIYTSGGPVTGSYRVIRGGSLGSDARFCRSASRYCSAPVQGVQDLGFRLCAPGR